jgi:hypothetical protein
MIFIKNKNPEVVQQGGNYKSQMITRIKRVCIRNSSSIQTLTVGPGVSPDRSRLWRDSRTFTAGRGLHPALKNIFNNADTALRPQN